MLVVAGEQAGTRPERSTKAGRAWAPWRGTGSQLRRPGQEFIASVEDGTCRLRLHRSHQGRLRRDSGWAPWNLVITRA